MSITIRHLSFSYGSSRILDDISFSLESGKILCILGANGAGKSTLFKNILGLLKPEQGEIFVDDRDIREYSIRERARVMAYIPQNQTPSFNYSVGDMVLMGTASQISMTGVPGEAQRNTAEQALEHLGISHLKERDFQKISGGEQQLVCIARALAQGAGVLIMDEPSANLDYGNQILLQMTLRKLAEEGYTIVQSTHNPEQAFMFADQILALQDGRVKCFGPAKEVINRELIQSLYHIDVSVESICNDRIRVCIPKEFQ